MNSMTVEKRVCIFSFHADKFQKDCLKMPKYYCDYCDTYLTHDSVSFIFYYKYIKRLLK